MLGSVQTGSNWRVPSAFEMTRALALAVFWPTPNAAQTSAILMYGCVDRSERKLIWPSR